MAEEYIQSLRKQLKGFPAEEQEALIDEIRSHIESGESDPKLGKDVDQRRKRMIHELGSPKDMGSNFKAIYHPNGLIDFLLILLPYLFYPYLNSLYNSLMPGYSWADVRLDILLHLPLVMIGLWRRSAALTLFWITVIVNQLFYITLQNNGYYGSQTIVWGLLLVALLALAGYLIWRHRNDPQIVIFGLMPLTMCIVGSILSTQNLMAYSLGFVGRSLLIINSFINNIVFYGLITAMALFFLPANRQVRWLGLVFYALMIGLSHEYLNNVFAGWAYSFWVILPLTMVFLGWAGEQIRKRKLEAAAS